MYDNGNYNIKRRISTKKNYNENGSIRNNDVFNVCEYGRKGWLVLSIIFDETGKITFYEQTDEEELEANLERIENSFDQKAFMPKPQVKEEVVFNKIHGKIIQKSEYDDNGNKKTLLKEYENGQVELTEYTCDDKGTVIKERALDTKGNETIKRLVFYDSIWTNWRKMCEVNGELRWLHEKLSEENGSVECFFDFLFDGEHEIRNESIRDQTKKLYEKYKYVDDKLIEKSVTEYLFWDSYPSKETLYKEINNKLVLINEVSHEYEFY